MSFDCQIPCALSFNIAMLYLPIDGALTVARDLWLSYSLCAFVGFTAGLSSAIRKRQTKGGARDELVLWFFVFFLFVYNLPTGEVFVVFFRRRDCCCLATIRPFRSLYFTQYHCLLQPASHPTTNTRVSIKLTHATP